MAIFNEVAFVFVFDPVMLSSFCFIFLSGCLYFYCFLNKPTYIYGRDITSQCVCRGGGGGGWGVVGEGEGGGEAAERLSDQSLSIFMESIIV